MKKTILFFLFLSVVVLADAQLRKIPADVTDAFTSRYPHATRVEWRDKLQYFEATFELNNATITANFSSKGDWEGSERMVSFDDLPDDVRDGFLKSKYSDWKKNTMTETQELGKPLQYRISVQKSGIQKKNLYFDTNGKLLKEAIAL
ncbi:MAG: PepSY-like domain-containing protein [Parafilimonas sp.]